MPEFPNFVDGPILSELPKRAPTVPPPDTGAPASALSIVMPGKNVLPSRLRLTSLGVKDWEVVASAFSRTKPNLFSQVEFGVKIVVLSMEISWLPERIVCGKPSTWLTAKGTEVGSDW